MQFGSVSLISCHSLAFTATTDGATTNCTTKWTLSRATKPLLGEGFKWLIDKPGQ